jgi:hypothetical protein
MLNQAATATRQSGSIELSAAGHLFNPGEASRIREKVPGGGDLSSIVLRIGVLARTVLRLVVVCPHWHKSLPFTPRDVISSGARNIATRQTYVTCLDCGKKFVYDWESMRLVNFWGT